MRILIVLAILAITLAACVYAFLVQPFWVSPVLLFGLAFACLACSLYSIPPGNGALVIANDKTHNIMVRNQHFVLVLPFLESFIGTYDRKLQPLSVEAEATTPEQMPIQVKGLLYYRLALDEAGPVQLAKMAFWSNMILQSELRKVFNAVVCNYFWSYHFAKHNCYACNREEVRRRVEDDLQLELWSWGVRDVSLRLDEVGPPEAWRDLILERRRQQAFLDVAHRAVPSNSEHATEEMARLLMALRAVQSGGTTSMPDLVLAGLFPQDHLNEVALDVLAHNGHGQAASPPPTTPSGGASSSGTPARGTPATAMRRAAP